MTLLKYVIVASSLYYERQHLVETSTCMARKAKSDGWEALTKAHQQAWHKIWDETDVVIQGDPEAQQGIRYNIFQLYQTYRGDDPRLNIAPKGFTGENTEETPTGIPNSAVSLFLAGYAPKHCKELTDVSL